MVVLKLFIISIPTYQFFLPLGILIFTYTRIILYLRLKSQVKPMPRGAASLANESMNTQVDSNGTVATTKPNKEQGDKKMQKVKQNRVIS